LRNLAQNLVVLHRAGVWDGSGQFWTGRMSYHHLPNMEMNPCPLPATKPLGRSKPPRAETSILLSPDSCYLLHFPIQLLIAIAFSFARLPIALR
jgi:hypothetical protein